MFACDPPKMMSRRSPSTVALCPARGPGPSPQSETPPATCSSLGFAACRTPAYGITTPPPAAGPPVAIPAWPAPELSPPPPFPRIAPLSPRQVISVLCWFVWRDRVYVCEQIGTHAPFQAPTRTHTYAPAHLLQIQDVEVGKALRARARAPVQVQPVVDARERHARPRRRGHAAGLQLRPGPGVRVEDRHVVEAVRAIPAAEDVQLGAQHGRAVVGAGLGLGAEGLDFLPPVCVCVVGKGVMFRFGGD